MNSTVFGYAIYGREIVIGTPVSLSKYREGHWVATHNNKERLFQSIYPFATAGLAVHFLSEAQHLFPSWKSYCTQGSRAQS
ncbi:hypothetical protein SAMN05421781_0323 [Marinococcus luteus]|uniref:Uncharacterized protein n=1 Tax=Marinococcus luteus TaxID=1122204 RepID=A0A1H2QIA1_9BACI|nr:hypothetical protein SAMN05421781_0323 [Marinococcus luteus]